jgi:NAD(P)H-flavin reductase
MIIVIHGVEYEVEDYAHSHPGGVEVLREYAGKDATEAFEAVGHSKDALQIMRRFRRGGDGPAQVSGLAKTPGIVRKLVTSEDRYHVHKFLGVFCLLHFGVRLGLGRSSWGVNTAVDCVCLCAHAALSASSLIFHVPQTMPSARPGIWSEFRIHSILFALRSIAYLIVTHVLVVPTSCKELVALCAVLVAMKCADVATEALKDQSSSSTTLGMPYWPGCPAAVELYFKRFYAFSQFSATLVMLVGSIHIQFMAVLPIQGAAFLLTLVRKGLVSTRAYHVCYSILLLIPWVTAPNVSDFVFTALGALILAYLRLVLRVNKYGLWVGVFALIMLVKHANVLSAGWIALCAGCIVSGLMLRDPERTRTAKPNIQSIDLINQDVYRIRIQCGHVGALKPGQHVVVTLGIVGRPYSPVRVDKESLDIVVRRYGQGTLSPVLTSLAAGASLSVSPPLGRNFVEDGVLHLNNLPVAFKRACLIAGGTGIAPLMAVARALSPESYRLVSIHRRSELLADDMRDLPRDTYIDQRPNLHMLLSRHEFDIVIVCGPPSLVAEVKRIHPTAVSW